VPQHRLSDVIINGVLMQEK